EWILQKPKDYGRWNGIEVIVDTHVIETLPGNSLSYYPWDLKTYVQAFKHIIENCLQLSDLPVFFLRGSPTNVCILACENCHSTNIQDEQPGATIPFEMYKDLISAAMQQLGARFLRVNGGGDPSLAPYIGDLLYWLGEQDIKISMNTNGVILAEKGLIEVLAHLASGIWISHKAGDARSYEALTHRDAKYFDRVQKNIVLLGREIQNARRQDEVLFEVSAFVHPETVGTLYELTRAAKDAGANYFKLELHRPRFSDVLKSPYHSQKLYSDLDRILTLHDANFTTNAGLVPRVYKSSEELTSPPNQEICFVRNMQLWIGAATQPEGGQGTVGELTPCHEMFNHQRHPRIVHGYASTGEELVEIWGSKKRRNSIQIYPPRTSKTCCDPSIGKYCSTPAANVHFNRLYNAILRHPDATFRKIYI
ncbi:hypothetical protein COY95_01200, partial [Candidatus Woesearchaeota archaeon CG_4_10_14_0_8_um_filter_47_5]